jgi:CheY-like chemotaxis protein
LAEDEDVVRQMLARLLSTAGYRTLEARNGTEALRMATFAYPYLHLVITSLPVLYISAYPADDLFHRGAPSTTSPYLQKPILPEELLRTVQQLLTGAREQTLQA